MKKFITITLTLALVLSLSVPVFAADNERQTKVSFTYDAPEPIYTVTIPATITLLSLDNPVMLAVEASNVENLGDKVIAVTYEDASMAVIPYYSTASNCFAISTPNATGQYYGSLGFGINYPDSMGISETLIPGTCLLEFDSNGTLYGISFWIVTDENSISAEDFDATRVLPNSEYTGWMTFGIKLVDAD